MGFLQKLIDNYRHAKEHRINRRHFLESVTKAISDGMLTDAEILSLQKEYAGLGLEEDDLKRVRVQIYNHAFAVAKADGKITHSEELELDVARKVFF